MEDYRKAYEEWLNDPYFDEGTRAELKAIENDDKEIRERFYTALEFGTAGLRGIIGAGTNRMNQYVVQRATQGLANYIVQCRRTEEGCGNRLRFQTYVSGIRRFCSADTGRQWD